MKAHHMTKLDAHVSPGTVSYDEHRRAMLDTKGVAAGLRHMLQGAAIYAAAIDRDLGYKIGDDVYLSNPFREILEGIDQLLSGPVGGWDCGSIDRNIRELAEESGIELER